MSNYAIKSDLKEATSINTSKLTKKVDLAYLKSDVNDLDIDKLKTVPVDLSKLIKSDAVESTLIDERVKNVNAIQTIHTSDLIIKC